MRKIIGIGGLAAILALGTFVGAGSAQEGVDTPLPSQSEVAVGGCMPGDQIDGSTAADARQKIEAAGYTGVTDLNKGCDNYWHGLAVKDGYQTNVVLTPMGEVKEETN